MKKIFPHVFVLFMFIILVLLGTWQVERRAYKQDLLARIDARINQSPISFDEYKNIDNDEYKKMKLSGKFLYDKEFFLLNKPYNGKQGQQVMTPLQLADGHTVIVDRGWIPSDKDPVKVATGTEITGVIRATQKLNAIGRAISLVNDPVKGAWFTIDLPAMYKALKLPEEDFYLDMINENNSKTFPVALPAKIELYNEHLQYVFTWYGLAIALLFVYYFRFFHKKKK